MSRYLYQVLRRVEANIDFNREEMANSKALGLSYDDSELKTLLKIYRLVKELSSIDGIEIYFDE